MVQSGRPCGAAMPRTPARRSTPSSPVAGLTSSWIAAGAFAPAPLPEVPLVTARLLLRLATTAALSLLPAALPAQAILHRTAVNQSFAPITGPIGRILSGRAAFATTSYVQQF